MPYTCTCDTDTVLHIYTYHRHRATNTALRRTVQHMTMRNAPQAVESYETTLFIVCSKTFTTIETITNATSAKVPPLLLHPLCKPLTKYCGDRHGSLKRAVVTRLQLPSTLLLCPPVQRRCIPAHCCRSSALTGCEGCCLWHRRCEYVWVLGLGWR